MVTGNYKYINNKRIPVLENMSFGSFTIVPVSYRKEYLQ